MTGFPSRSGGFGDLGGFADGLAFGEHLPDLGDMASAAPSGVCVEAELDREIRRWQQAQLSGDVVFVHGSIMNEACHRVSGAGS